MKTFAKMKAAMAVVGMIVAFSFISKAQTSLYFEDFPYPNGTTQGSGFPSKWTISGNPIFWDHFEVRNNRIEANKISIEGAWISQDINITGFTNVTISLDVESSGSLSAASDYLRGFYKLNGGSEVQWFNVAGSTSPTSKTITVANGNTLQVVLRTRNDNGETYFFDNGSITGQCATNAGTASVSNTVINSGQTVDLSLTGHSGSIQWQQSTNNINFTDIAGGTTTPFTTAQLTGPNTFYFRAKITSGCPNFSNTVSVVVNQATNNFTTDSLHINRIVTIGSNTLVLENDPGGAENSIYTTNSNGGGLLLQSQSGFPFHTIINGNNLGFIGMGTLTPGLNYSGGLKLDVRGHGRFGSNDNDYVRLGFNGANSIIDNFGSGILLLNFYSGKDVHLGTGASPSNFKVGGNTGLGADPDPNFRLTVCGKIRAKEVLVETFGCDYVFEENYKLMTIPEFRAYLKKNKHLPNIPSAKEVEANGMNVGEMQSRLLEKIEENSLYVIQLYEMIAKQNEEIEQLKKKNAELESQLKK